MVEGSDGKSYYEFAGEYTHAGKKWGLNIFALDAEDASQKLESLKNSMVLVGKVDSGQTWNPLAKYRLGAGED